MEDLGLLRTKLYRPSVPADLVPRSRLLDRLDRQLWRPLTLVSAPAGYGKTTLVNAWLQSLGERSPPVPGAWLSLDGGDSDLVQFLSYLLAAVRTLYPDACRGTLAMLTAATLPPIHILANSLINELDRIEQRFVLVLDDVHVLRERVVLDLLAELLHHPPRALHLVLVSRIDPLLSLTRLRAQSQMTEIRTTDLRFTDAEVAAYLRSAMGVAVDEAAASALGERTEGWVTGLRLAILSLRHRGKLEDLLAGMRGDSRYVQGYLVSEVLARQPPAVQDYLLQTSILDRFCAPLCEAVVRRSESGAVRPGAGAAATAGGLQEALDGREFLEWLERTDLFVVPLDAEGHWVRYHHLFQELLQHRLRQVLGADDLAGLHARAGAWYARHGYVQDALQHTLAAGDLTGAAQLVEANVHEALSGDEYYVLDRWMQALPGGLVEQRPGLLLAKAWLSQHRLDMRALRPLVQAAETLLARGAPQVAPLAVDVLRGEIDCFQGMLSYWRGDGQQCLHHLQHALERVPRSHMMARGMAAFYLGLAYQMLGHTQKAMQATYRAFYQDRRSSDLLETRLQSALMLIHFLSGDLYPAAQAARTGLAAAVRGKLLNSIGLFHYDCGLVDYEWNDLPGAIQHFSNAIDLRYVSHPRAAVGSYVGLVLALQAQGHCEQARTAAETLIAYAQETGNPTHVAIARSAQARLSLLQGGIEPARCWLLARDNEVEVELPFAYLESATLTRARVLVALGVGGTRLSGEMGPLQEALDILAGQLRIDRSTHNTLQVIRVLCLQAFTCDALGQTKDALCALKEAVALGRPGGFVRTFVDTGPALVPLFHQLVEQGTAPEYLGRVLAAFEPPSSRDPEPGPLAEPLTPREREALCLLATDLGTDEIAAEMVVSLATVRTYAKRIYAKLAVHSRFEAVQRARELGLF